MTNLGRSIRAAALLVLATGSMGCSVVGLSVGAVIDSKKSDAEREGVEILATDPGARVTAVRFGGERVTGKLAGAYTGLGVPYGPAFAASCERLPDQPIPRPGERVRLDGEGGAATSRGSMVLAGTDRHRVVLRDGNNVRTLRFAELGGVAGVRGVMDGETLGALVEAGRIPAAEGVLLREGRESRPVAFGEVGGFLVRRKGNAKLVGFLVGLVVDAVIVVNALTDIDISGGGPIVWDERPPGA